MKVLIVLAVLLGACQPAALVKKLVKTGTADYLALPEGGKDEVWSVTKVSPHVWSFATHFDRGIFVVTDEGIVVVDPFNKLVAAKLKAHLDEHFAGKRVVALIYSHYHLDHVRGGEILAPAAVLAHVRCPEYWKDFDAKDILAPTKLLDGDVTLDIGGVLISLVQLPHGHTDTNYAVHVPADKLLFVADMAFVKAFPPYGMPDVYRPGQIAGLRKLAVLDFDVFVPSHFGVGKKRDLEENVSFYESTQLAARRIVRASEGFPPPTKAAFDATIDGVYDELEQKYGDWYGFESQGLQLVLRNVIGEGLGY